MVKITGNKRHSDRLRRGSTVIRSILSPIVKASADEVTFTAKALIIEGSVSGPGHIPSKPYEPPNADTHYLDQHIITRPVNDLRYESASTAEYAGDLELGYTVIERPYMRPASKLVRGEFIKRVRNATMRSLK